MSKPVPSAEAKHKLLGAVLDEDAQLVKELLNRSNINAPLDPIGWTILRTMATYTPSMAPLQMVLEFGPDVNLRDFVSIQ